MLISNRMPRTPFLYRTDREHSDWRINYVYRQSLDPTLYASQQKANPDKPHAVVFVSEGARLRDGIICTSELLTLLYFAGDSSVITTKNPHAIYPVRTYRSSSICLSLWIAIVTIVAPHLQRLTNVGNTTGHGCHGIVRHSSHHAGDLECQDGPDSDPNVAHSRVPRRAVEELDPVPFPPGLGRRRRRREDEVIWPIEVGAAARHRKRV